MAVRDLTPEEIDQIFGGAARLAETIAPASLAPRATGAALSVLEPVPLAARPTDAADAP